MNSCNLPSSAPDLLPVALAVAFLGALAFVAWLLWLKRTDVRKQHAAETEALKSYVQGEVMKLGPAIVALDARVDALAGAQVVKAAFGGGQ